MKRLFIDTHSEKITVILCSEDKVFTSEATTCKSHSEVAVPTINEMLLKHDVKCSELDEIIVVNGPGSFTGVRIGVTIAKTMAYTLNIPIKTITSLEMYGISCDEDFDVVTIEDAKGVYSARRENDKFVDFMYQSKTEFDEYIKANKYKILENRKIEIGKVLEYLEDKDSVNPHKVNPIYIKEIDALK